jgi:hypothetical protein
VAVKPDKKLIYQKENKNPVRKNPCNAQRNSIQKNIQIQKIFLLKETLQLRTERLLDFVFLQIIELIDESTRCYTENRAENDAVHLDVKYKTVEALFLIKQKKSERHTAQKYRKPPQKIWRPTAR